jgi:hypothetical protein
MPNETLFTFRKEQECAEITPVIEAPYEINPITAPFGLRRTALGVLSSSINFVQEIDRPIAGQDFMSRSSSE